MSFVTFVNFSVSSSFSFGFEGQIWDVIVFIPDHCLSVYFTFDTDNYGVVGR